MVPKRLYNLYDSHVHWLATGQHRSRLKLDELHSPQDVLQLNVESYHFRGDWLLGWGWDQSLWDPPQFPHRKVLDQRFPDTPVCFSRVDGHAFWVNSEALRRAELLSGQADWSTELLQSYEPEFIPLDEEGAPRGVFLDLAMGLIFRHIPPVEKNQLKESLMHGAQLFNAQGFTRIRDLSCSPEQWQASVELEESGDLTLAVDQFFSMEDPDGFDRAFDLALHAKKQSQNLLKPRGLKVHLDGALGSEGALLSESYPSGFNGLDLLSEDMLREFMLRSWEEELDLAVHCIGDMAADRVVRMGRELKEKGLRGQLHIEHAQVMRPETIKVASGLELTCHLQPCHWLSDRRWLREKLGVLYACVFPWDALNAAGIEIYFGSDSPVEKPSLFHNVRAVIDAADEGIPPLEKPWLYHQYRGEDRLPNTYTDISQGEVQRVVFQGKSLSKQTHRG